MTRVRKSILSKTKSAPLGYFFLSRASHKRISTSVLVSRIFLVSALEKLEADLGQMRRVFNERIE
jgi:hypothetical protein